MLFKKKETQTSLEYNTKITFSLGCIVPMSLQPTFIIISLSFESHKRKVHSYGGKEQLCGLHTYLNLHMCCSSPHLLVPQVDQVTLIFERLFQTLFCFTRHTQKMMDFFISDILSSSYTLNVGHLISELHFLLSIDCSCDFYIIVNSN